MSIKKSSNHKYDYIIIGAGISGLLMAAGLSRFTQNIALLEGQDSWGGFNRPINNLTGSIDNGLRFFPFSSAGKDSVRWLENLLGLKINHGPFDSNPITYESGHFKNFLGFGDHPPEFYDEFQYFLNPESMQLSIKPAMWPTLLFNQFKGDYLPRHYVTKIIQDKETAQGVIVNGSKTLLSENIIFCGNVRDLAVLVPDDIISTRAKQKLTKSTYWSAVCLDLTHSHTVTDKLNLHVLNGTTVDELGPCVGQFHQPFAETTDKTFQVSQWLTFVNEESTEDSEVIAHALKKIKRQIKRAYPEALEKIQSERIFVASQIGGNGDLKLSANQSLPHLHNFWVASGSVNSFKNLLGTLKQAELVLSSLGFEITAQSEVFDCPDEQPMISDLSN